MGENQCVSHNPSLLSEDDPSSPWSSASTICFNLLEALITCREQVAQSNEVENREFVPRTKRRIRASKTATLS
jgi:hypothetical protein